MEKDFAKRLKQIRKERGYTQKQLSDIANIPVHTIRNYEQDICKPITMNLLELAKVLDVTPEYLLLGENNMNTYTMAIKKELLQLKDYKKISKIKGEEFNSTILSHLEMGMELVEDIKTEWNNAGVFIKENDDGTIEESYCTRNYVQEIIIKYCQNRMKFKTLFNLKDGMLLELNN